MLLFFLNKASVYYFLKLVEMKIVFNVFLFIWREGAQDVHRG